jgi:hypothetical protein
VTAVTCNFNFFRTRVFTKLATILFPGRRNADAGLVRALIVLSGHFLVSVYLVYSLKIEKPVSRRYRVVAVRARG